MSANTQDLSKLTDEEVTQLLKLLNHKQLFKDPLSTSSDSISNCVSITPFRCLSSYNLWIRRNLLYLSDTEEYIYPIGTNIIIEKIKTKQQQIIPLKSRCYVTSLTLQNSQTNERILFIGEMIHSEETDKNSGRVEILNLDNRVLRKKINLDLSVYVDYSSYVYDIISPKNSDNCIIILKNISNNVNTVELLLYNYVTF